MKMRVVLAAQAILGTTLAVGNACAIEPLPRRAGVAATVEQFENAAWEPGTVQDARGNRLRTLITIPRTQGRLPAVFLAGWLSCDSVEVSRNAQDGVARLLYQLIEESGAIVMRVDKPGVGDSEGKCAETDFETELSGYHAAFAQLRAHPRVDATRIVMLGISIGGGISPLVAEGAPVAAYVSIGGWSKTWFEHMIELERRRLALEGHPQSVIGAELRALAEFHAAYLFERRTPAQVIAARPHLESAWYDEPAHQYGRPASYYHQLQSLDLAAAWSAVEAPALVVWGTYDWIMSREDQSLIVELVNARKPGRAHLLTVESMDHGFSIQPSRNAAYRQMGAGAYPARAAAEILQFIRASYAQRPGSVGQLSPMGER